MDTIFMNPESSKTSDPHRLLLSLYDKLNLKRSDNMLGYQILAFIYMEKCKKIISEYEIWNLNYLMNHILYQTFKITLNIS